MWIKWGNADEIGQCRQNEAMWTKWDNTAEWRDADEAEGRERNKWRQKTMVGDAGEPIGER
jgi:hypothetical protein